jgi:hypothetical protein
MFEVNASNYGLICLGFEVPTVMVMKSSILWDITPYTRSLLKVNGSFEGISSESKNKLSKKPA